MSLNSRVVVIFSNPLYSCGEQPFPPVGSIGEVVSGFDEFGECDVLFDGYLCPTVCDPSWVTHRSMIVFLADEDLHIEQLSEIKNLYAELSL